MLINRFNDELAVLFRDVTVPEHHTRRFDEKLGDYVVNVVEARMGLRQKEA